MFPTIHYDGYCNMCSGIIRFIYRHGGKAKFRFVPMSSADLSEPSGSRSVILESGGKRWQKSSAVLRICILMGFPWNLVAPALLIPASWRDAMYDFVAERRYRWMGRRESCYIPEKDDAGQPD